MVELLDLVEKDVLIRLQEKFSELLGFNVAFAGLNSKTVGYDEDEEKTEDRAYIRGTTCALMSKTIAGKERCFKSDKEAGEIAIEQKKPILYRCQSYCSNFVIPIKVSDEIIGFLYSGQFFAYKPGEKTALEWKSLQVRRGISDDEWEQKKKEIVMEEEKDWDKLLREQSFFIVYDKGISIQPYFFHKRGSPSDGDLEEIAKKGSLGTGRSLERFVKTFRETSNPDHPNNRVKDAREIITAIKILSEIANALSEECNTKYALKTYCETYQETKQTPFYMFRTRKVINKHLEHLSEAVKPFIQESGETPTRRAELTKTIDRIASKIYKKLLLREIGYAIRDAKLNKYLFFKSVSKNTYATLQTILENVKNDTGSLIKRKERLRKNLHDVRKYREEILGMRTLAGPITWLGIIVAILFGLNQIGVI